VPRGPHLLVTLGFVALVGSVPLIQATAELRRGERPGVLDLLDQAPTVAHLRAYEKRLEEASVVEKALRPWTQYAQFMLLADAGEKALVGREGWLFYRPGLRYLTERPPAAGPHPEGTRQTDDPLPAIVSFRDQLAARGIRLLVLPVPNKESIYPEMLTRRADGVGVIVSPQTRALLDRLHGAGIEVVDLFEEYRRAKQERGPSDAGPLYLVQDSHWSPAGIRLAAASVARRLVELGWVSEGNTPYDERTATVRRHGDVLQMLQVPQIERGVPPEEIACHQVIRRGTQAPYRDAPDAAVLVLGDSFLRIYEQDEPQAAGFIAHLAREMKQPLASIASDGGASTVVRQELYRRGALLAGKRVVVWEFVDRDIRFGAEGWQVIPLPPEGAAKQ
jgi:hypothetical protein